MMENLVDALVSDARRVLTTLIGTLIAASLIILIVLYVNVRSLNERLSEHQATPGHHDIHTRVIELEQRLLITEHKVAELRGEWK